LLGRPIGGPIARLKGEFNRGGSGTKDFGMATIFSIKVVQTQLGNKIVK